MPQQNFGKILIKNNESTIPAIICLSQHQTHHKKVVKYVQS